MVDAHHRHADIWIPSKYNISTRFQNSQRVVANLLTGEMETLSHRTWDRYLRPGRKHMMHQGNVPALLSKFFKRGFLVSKEVDEVEQLKFHFLQCRFNDVSARVAIAPTMNCNLRCPYCFEGNARNERGSSRMSQKTESAVIRFVKELAEGKKRLVINWYGGEPLVRLSTIESISSSIIPALEKEGCSYEAIMTSNGVLLRDGVAEKLKRFRVNSCQISVDIPCSNKRDSRGREVQEVQLDNILKASKYIKTKLRINIAADDEAQFDLLYSRLLERRLQHKIINLSFAAVTPVERPACTDYRMLTGEILREVLRREVPKAEKLGFPIMKFHPFVPSPCGATSNYSMLIGPDGSLYKCPSDLGKTDRAFGSVHSNQLFRPGNLLPWLSYDWFQYKECRDCPILPVCAGGCPHRRMYGYSKPQYCDLMLSDYKEQWRQALLDYASGKTTVAAKATVHAKA
jgi:uncharacterized protein